MGTISERTDNKGAATFQAKIRRKGFPALSQTFPTREEAERWVLGAEAALRIRSSAAATKQAKWRAQLTAELHARPRIVADLLDRYLVDETPQKKGAAVETYRIRAMLDSPLALVHLTNLTQRDLRDWRDQRLTQVSASTINRELTLLNVVLKLARREWDVVLSDSVFNGVRRPQNPPARDRRMSAQEQVALFEACADTRGGYLRAIVELALETGMRQSELVALEWDRVNLPRRTIRLMEGATKNGHGRGVPLSRRAVEVLESIAPEDERQGRVFPDLTTEAVKRAFIRTCKRAGIENFHFHDLRHEATSRLFEKGLSQMEVASITGHKDIRMLQRYTHLQVRDLAAKLD
ncbi:site-specific integrase [Ralstonia sp. ASV6]|uniref:tyrosine-type recombinase/integrase n=1 Tax=Ralstonia sp. ASV6 TaxID=2795124 RepID=UPI0018EDDCD9|nr:site-specific integrase [Ralstonia sp. ASV6]